MKSIWWEDIEIATKEKLDKNIEVDIGIVGGGLAGILIAYFLKEKGKKAIILEADRIASGQTQNTTAKITSQHELIYSKLIDKLGFDKAKQYADANQQAISEYRDIINSKKIDCDFEEKDAYLYTCQDEQALKDEYEAAKSLSIDCFYTETTKLPIKVKGALCFKNQAQFNPLKFINAISEDLTIYEKTKVTEINDNEIVTENGVVTADKIVIASHYPIINAPGYYFARIHQERSYLLALENAADVKDMYRGIDSDGLTFRNYKNYLLFGGGGHRTGENSEGGKYKMLREKAKEYYPNSKEVAYWSAQDCFTIDDVPYIGQYAASTPDMYVATGFRKWGMTSSMVSAMIISDMICGNKSPYEEVFSPQRFEVTASIKNFIKDGAQAVKGLSRQIFKAPKTLAEDLPIGHGGIVEYEGEKVGVYKDDKGEIYMVEPKCTHLGCQLEWNPDELSWDCPCHGSRFDYKGNLINNPALKNIEKIDYDK